MHIIPVIHTIGRLYDFTQTVGSLFSLKLNLITYQNVTFKIFNQLLRFFVSSKLLIDFLALNKISRDLIILQKRSDLDQDCESNDEHIMNPDECNKPQAHFHKSLRCGRERKNRGNKIPLASFKSLNIFSLFFSHFSTQYAHAHLTVLSHPFKRGQMQEEFCLQFLYVNHLMVGGLQQQK